MKKIIYLKITSLLIAISLVISLIGDTPIKVKADTNGGTVVTGLISTNATWNSKNGPYIVKGNILVEQGVTLTIEEGTEVIFDGDYYIQVNGNLNANGTAQDYIRFTSNGNNSGKIMLNSNSNVLNFCSMSNMVWGIYFCDNSSYNKIYNCTIINNIFGLYVNYSNSNNEIRHCLIGENSNTGIYLFRGCTSNNIEDCTIYNQSSTDSMNPGCGIHFDADSDNNSVKNCFILGNNYGIDFYPNCTNNSIMNNDIQKNNIGINFENYGWNSDNKSNINNNNICNNIQYNLSSGHNSSEVNAENNYWGTTDENQIDNSIYDFYDDFSRTIVLFKPYLNNPIVVTVDNFDKCDINKDGIVNILDMALIAKRYNVKNTDTNWDSTFDFNNDGIVDIFDLVLCSKKIS